MAVPTFISSESVGAGGNATVPADCDLVVCKDGTAGTLGGVSLLSAGNTICYLIDPPTGVQVNSRARILCYFKNGRGGKVGNNGGNSVSGLWSGTVTATATCVIFGWASGDGGPYAVQAPSGTPVNYVSGTSIGYRATGTTNPTCYGRDDGAGHSVDAGFASFEYGTPVPTGPTGVKKVSGVAVASIKKISGVAVADIKKVSGVG